jgi:hypothetical protein
MRSAQWTAQLVGCRDVVTRDGDGAVECRGRTSEIVGR